MSEARHLSTFISRPPDKVYAFASNPENLPLWAAGLSGSEIRQEGESWIVNAPFGKARVRFKNCKTCRVMDHDVELESGVVVHNPMRVVPNGNGSEFVFTLIRRPDMTDESFEQDADAVKLDLAKLKRVLESEVE